jgi:hypothetical protein
MKPPNLNKQQAKQAKALAKAHKRLCIDVPKSGNGIDCACVIHGKAYDWTYVLKLYNMLLRNSGTWIRLHVYTEADRPVPEPFIKHSLIEWKNLGTKKDWWYKMQLFNSEHFRGPLLYFDLDTVIVGNIDWITELSTQYFWSIKDFKHLWRPTHRGFNSSVMWWDTAKFDWVWQQFQETDISQTIRYYHGDQDYISELIDHQKGRHFDPSRIKSWRWQCLHGGYDFRRRRYVTPGTGSLIPPDTSVLIFHGHPKPSETNDPVVVQNWC